MARISGGGEFSVDAKLIRHKSVNVGVLKESKNYDAVVIGYAALAAVLGDGADLARAARAYIMERVGTPEAAHGTR